MQTKIGTLQLVTIIEDTILLGTEIHSDCWRAYNAINAIPVIPNYIHKTVNYKTNFVDPVTGTHTNNGENFWKNVKIKHKALGGAREVMLPTYLDEHLWRI